MLSGWIAIFRREERAQDLIEYTLLIGFLAVAVVGLFSTSGSSLQGLWTTAGSTLAVANSTPADTSAGPPPSGRGDRDRDGGGGD